MGNPFPPAPEERKPGLIERVFGGKQPEGLERELVKGVAKEIATAALIAAGEMVPLLKPFLVIAKIATVYRTAKEEAKRALLHIALIDTKQSTWTVPEGHRALVNEIIGDENDKAAGSPSLPAQVSPEIRILEDTVKFFEQMEKEAEREQAALQANPPKDEVTAQKVADAFVAEHTEAVPQGPETKEGSHLEANAESPTSTPGADVVTHNLTSTNEAALNITYGDSNQKINGTSVTGVSAAESNGQHVQSADAVTAESIANEILEEGREFDLVDEYRAFNIFMFDRASEGKLIRLVDVDASTHEVTEVADDRTELIRRIHEAPAEQMAQCTWMDLAKDLPLVGKLEMDATDIELCRLFRKLLVNPTERQIVLNEASIQKVSSNIQAGETMENLAPMTNAVLYILVYEMVEKKICEKLGIETLLFDAAAQEACQPYLDEAARTILTKLGNPI
ncbi:MAG: hypothetical protein HOO67_07400 [Candidatus Peribacteraceae bacterium]|nr:hypothetical protein [Candidatus Peribacteraceae bacterium]